MRRTLMGVQALSAKIERPPALEGEGYNAQGGAFYQRPEER
jgi:hypothetical protein